MVYLSGCNKVIYGKELPSSNNELPNLNENNIEQKDMQKGTKKTSKFDKFIGISAGCFSVLGLIVVPIASVSVIEPNSLMDFSAISIVGGVVGSVVGAVSGAGVAEGLKNGYDSLKEKVTFKQENDSLNLDNISTKIKQMKEEFSVNNSDYLNNKLKI